MRTIVIPDAWEKDWKEIKKHVILNETFNHSEILSIDSDLMVMAALIATYQAKEMN